MFLRSKIFLCPRYLKASKRLLSNHIKEVLDARLDPPAGCTANPLQLAVVIKNLNAFNLDLFVNNLSEHEDRSTAVLDLLANLRATKLANTCLESTHFAAVRHLLENLTIQEVIPVLLNRPKYGIFLNNFTAFAVVQILHEEKEYNLGLPLVLKLILSEEVDSLFVLGFCLKAALVTLKEELSGQQPSDDKIVKPTKGKVQEIKVRVKFLRNEKQVDMHNEIGKAILKIKSKILEGNKRVNAEILGHLLTKNYIDLDKTLNVKSIKIYEDVADICTKLLAKESQIDLVDKINKLQDKVSFESLIDKMLEETSVQEAVTLAEKQKLLIPIWQEQRSQVKLEVEKEIAKSERKENIKVINNEISEKKDLLWFFDNEDKLDLEIYNKRVFYPKRWFGKKKKPRVVDEHYVPPEIRKIN